MSLVVGNRTSCFHLDDLLQRNSIKGAVYSYSINTPPTVALVLIRLSRLTVFFGKRNVPYVISSPPHCFSGDGTKRSLKKADWSLLKTKKEGDMTPEAIRGRKITIIIALIVAIPAVLRLILLWLLGLPHDLFTVGSIAFPIYCRGYSTRIWLGSRLCAISLACSLSLQVRYNLPTS
jgi:hypothetical protein